MHAQVVERIGLSGSAPTGSPPFTPRAKKVLELSLREALQLGHNYIGTEHLLLGIVREGEGVAAQVLSGLGADLPKVREQVTLVLQSHPGSGTERTSPLPPTTRRFPPLETGRSALTEPVGKDWTARVVRPGRTPADYAEAYEDLAELVAAHGIELDDVEPRQLIVTSVETNDGPGFALSMSHSVDEEPDDDVDDQGNGDTE